MRRKVEMRGKTYSRVRVNWQENGMGGWRGLPGERLAVWGADGGVAEYVRCDKGAG